MNSKNKTAAKRIVFRDVKPARKPATVEINEWEAWCLLKGARENLGRIVAEYDGRETFRFLIDEAKANVAKWQAVSDSFEK